MTCSECRHFKPSPCDGFEGTCRNPVTKDKMACEDPYCWVELSGDFGCIFAEAKDD